MVSHGLVLVVLTVLCCTLTDSFLDHPSGTVVVLEGQRAVLTCNITHRIPSWKGPFGGQLSYPDQPHMPTFVLFKYRIRMTLNFNQLIIDNTNLNDKGKYTCSYPGKGSGTVYLQVNKPIHVSKETTPMIAKSSETTASTRTSISTSKFSSSQTPAVQTTTTIKTSTVYLLEGQQVFLKCGITSKIPKWTYPDGQIINFKGFSIMNPSFQHSDRFSVNATGALKITDIKPNDAGRYNCSYPGDGSEIFDVQIKGQTTTIRTKLHSTYTSTPNTTTISTPFDMTTTAKSRGSSTVQTTIERTTLPSTYTSTQSTSLSSTPFSKTLSTVSKSSSIGTTTNMGLRSSSKAAITGTATQSYTTIGTTTSKLSSTTEIHPMNSSGPTSAFNKTRETTTAAPISSFMTSSNQPILKFLTVYYLEGQQMILTCDITNKIPAWTSPDGGIINFSDTFHMNPSFPHRDRFSLSPTGELRINDTKTYDAGQYRCSYPGIGSEVIDLKMAVQPATDRRTSLATNISTTTTEPMTTSLRITTDTTQQLASTTANHSLNNTVYFSEGQQVILKCDITNQIPMWISPDGGIINFSDSDSMNPSFPHRDRFSVSQTGDLKIKNAKTYDSGQYVCSYPGNGSKVIDLKVGGIDGGWSTWSGWVGCSQDCKGVRVRIRSCSNPLPSENGIHCSGLGFEEELCSPTNCQVSVSTSATSTSDPSPTANTVSHNVYETRALTTKTSSLASTTTRPNTTIKSAASTRHKLTSTLNTASSTISSSSVFWTSTSTTSNNNSTSSQTSSSLAKISKSQSTPASFTIAPTPSTSRIQNVSRSTAATFTRPPTPSATRNQSFSSSSAALVNTTYSSLTVASSVNSSITVPKTTSKPVATIPPLATKCAICAGPPAACEVAFYEDYCPPPNQYCINHITNLADGQRLVERKCGNVMTCYNEWYLGTSDDDKCRRFSSSTVMTYAFECTFCCIKDGCNVDLHPKADTLYSNTQP